MAIKHKLSKLRLERQTGTHLQNVYDEGREALNAAFSENKISIFQKKKSLFRGKSHQKFTFKRQI